MAKVVAIIQARLNSTRLPGKILMPIAGRPMLAHVIERAAAIPGLSLLPVLAIPAQNKAQILTAITESAADIFTWDGDENDVLGRIYRAANYTLADIVIRLTGDCALFDPSRPMKSLDAMNRAPFPRYQSETYYPGLDHEIFRIERLNEAHWRCDHAEHREHVGPAIRCLDGCPDLVEPPNADFPWLAVDTVTDLERVRAVFAHLDDPKDFSLAATLRAWEKAGRP